MNRKTVKLSCIIWEPHQSAVLLKETQIQERFKIPEYSWLIGDNLDSLSKSEIESDFLITTKFVRKLPDTWSKLINLYAEMEDKLHIYNIYMFTSFIDKKSHEKDTDYFWAEINNIDESYLSVADESALATFKEMSYNL